MAKEHILTCYEVPEAKDGDIYIRVPVIEDKDPSTMRVDRETGEFITLWEEKIRYPYKTNCAYNVIIKTLEELTYDFKLKMDTDGTYCYNGSNIPRVVWTLLGLNPGSPEGMVASLAHDNLLQFKKYFYQEALKVNATLSPMDFLHLTTGMYEQLLMNNGVGKIRASLMGFFINVYQRFFNPQWKDLDRYRYSC